MDNGQLIINNGYSLSDVHAELVSASVMNNGHYAPSNLRQAQGTSQGAITLLTESVEMKNLVGLQ